MGDFLEEAGQLMSLSMMVSASSGPSRLMGGGRAPGGGKQQIQ